MWSPSHGCGGNMFAVKCACAGMWVFAALATVAQIDKPRNPITRLDAILALVFHAFFAWVLFQ